MKYIMKKGLKTFGCILLAVAIAMTGTYIPALETVTVVEAASPVAEKAISWAIAIANDNSHGYSQSSRWGPDYDCSSFVISAFRNAGVDVGTAVTTRNMRSQFTQHGFQWIPWGQIGGTSNLQRGDILLNEQAHTEIYLGGNQNVGAHSNRGYPQTGDQTGTEVSVSGYYYHPWDGVLRYMGNDVCNCSTDYAADYYVLTNSLPLTMRSGHGTNYSIVTSIPKGSQVYVSRADGNWAHVEWNGYSGYCSMEYLTKIASKSYNLHVWVSNTGMGSIPSNFVLGERYYICYELIDESTGKKANETSNIRYQATETVRSSKGMVFEHTYENSDYNWISVVCDSEDTYTGTVTISGDVGISCSVSFEVFADTVPEMKVWAWEGDDSNEISTIDVGKTAYCSYLIRDQRTKKNLNDATVFWTKGEGYGVTIKIYDPSGTLVKTQSYKNNDCTWFEFVPDKIGEYKIKSTVTGKLAGGGYERTIKVEEKEHKYGSWKIIKKPTCTQTGTQTRTCTICKKTQTQTIAKTEHAYDSGIITKPATCIAAGTKIYTCIICGAVKDESLPTVSHTLVKDDVVAPTYTEEGLTEGTHCSVCGKVITAQKIIPVMTHAPVVTESPRPTNTTEVIEDLEIVQEQETVKESTIVEKPATGTILKDAKSGILYKVLVPGRSVELNGVTNRKIVKAVVPDTVVIDGIKYQVTKISNNAFSKCRKLKSVTIGKNVTSIGNKAFYKCSKLKTITLKSKKLKSKSVGTKSFRGIHKKAVIKVPISQKKAYEKWLKKKGITKTVKITKYLSDNQETAARTIKGTMNMHACKSGRFLYYSYNSGGTRDGIIRLDTKTGKKKTIIENSMTDSSGTNGFENLTIKGKYIYAVWDKYMGTDGALNYIYRISIDGSSVKELACGRDMVIVGNRIYYNKCKYVDDGYEGYTEIIGKASMKLDGTDKKSEKGNIFRWKSSKCEIYNLYTKGTKEYKNGKYKYYPSANGKKLIRKSNSGKLKTIFKVSGKYSLSAIEIHDDMLLVQCDNNSARKNRVYFVKNSGSGKRLLKEWTPAE